MKIINAERLKKKLDCVAEAESIEETDVAFRNGVEHALCSIVPTVIDEEPSISLDDHIVAITDSRPEDIVYAIQGLVRFLGSNLDIANKSQSEMKNRLVTINKLATLNDRIDKLTRNSLIALSDIEK